MYESRGAAKFYYSYDANGVLYSVKYTLTDTSDLQTYYYSHNSRGDIEGIYNGNGELRAKYEYDAWGNVLSIKDQNGNAITSATHIGNLNPFRYRSYYYDSESGLYYLMSRYYDPVTHRFINADGYFQSGGDILDANMSVYCRNNPIMNYDPTGECSVNNPCPNPACVNCHPSIVKFYQTKKGLALYNKCHETNYIGIRDDGVFISENSSNVSSTLSQASSGLTATRGTVYSIVGAGAETALSSAGIAAAGTVVSTSLSIGSHMSNPYLTDSQKVGFVIGNVFFAAVGIGWAVVLTNFWNPVGWSAGAVFAATALAGITYNAATSVAMWCAEEAVVNNNKKNWGM